MSPQATTRALDVGRRVGRRLSALEVIDRSLVLGAQAFGALIPLLIVFASLGYRNGRSFADGIIARFELTGQGAATVRETLAAPADSASLMTWNLQRRGVRAAGFVLVIAAALGAYIVHPEARG